MTLGGTSLHSGAKRHPTLERGVIVGAGAQVLGSFTVGEYAKVGSNAVLLKPVPSGATAVGNPAHIVQKDVSALREGSTAHLFAAYGVTPNGDDPLSKALQGLITHAVAQEQRIETILATLKAAGICCQGVPECDKFDSEQMNKLVD
ncbi:Serine acetyltransferase [compost metagenome]